MYSSAYTVLLHLLHRGLRGHIPYADFSWHEIVDVFGCIRSINAVVTIDKTLSIPIYPFSEYKNGWITMAFEVKRPSPCCTILCHTDPASLLMITNAISCYIRIWLLRITFTFYDICYIKEVKGSQITFLLHHIPQTLLRQKKTCPHVAINVKMSFTARQKIHSFEIYIHQSCRLIIVRDMLSVEN